MPTLGKWLDRLCVAFLLAATASGMIMGGGVSITARSVFQLFATAAFACSVGSMLALGRWRLIASPLLALPLLMAAFAVAQLAPLPGLADYRASGPWVSAKPTSVLLISANRHATMQAAFLLIAASMLAFAAAQHLRTARRLRMIGIVMFALLATSCAIGVLQQTSKNRKPFGIVPMSNATPVLRDVYSTETAIGLAAYRSWDEVPASLGMRPSIANSSAYFAPVTAATQPFAGFLQRQQWTICCIAVIPLLLTFAAQFLVQASAYGATDWPWTWEGKRALLWFAGALSLGGLATWFGDPIVVPAAVLAAAIAAAILAGPERGQAIRLAAVLWVVVVGVGAIRLGTAGGMQALQDRIAVASSDNRSLWSAFLDHRWFGCGLGASGELWTLYRSNPSDKPMQASSLLAAAVELGWLGMGIVAAVGLYSTGKWLWVRGRLDAQARLLVGGAASAVFAMTAFAALGPGLEAPVLLGIAAVLVGCLARGLNGGYCNFGGLES